MSYQITCIVNNKWPQLIALPFLFLFLSFLQFLQVFLGQLDDVRRLLLWSQHGGGERAGPSVERLTAGGTRQILPQILIDSFALQEFGSEEEVQGHKHSHQHGL